jgi:hypothetical protein
MTTPSGVFSSALTTEDECHPHQRLDVEKEPDENSY